MTGGDCVLYGTKAKQSVPVQPGKGQPAGRVPPKYFHLPELPISEGGRIHRVRCIHPSARRVLGIHCGASPPPPPPPVATLPHEPHSVNNDTKRSKQTHYDGIAVFRIGTVVMDVGGRDQRIVECREAFV